MDTVTFYVDESESERAENILHREVIDDEMLSSVTVEDDLAVVRVTGGELPNEPGVINEIVSPMAEAGINIHELITSATSVAIVVAWDDREETLKILQELY
jgi:aspartate kinase